MKPIANQKGGGEGELVRLRLACLSGPFIYHSKGIGNPSVNINR